MFLYECSQAMLTRLLVEVHLRGGKVLGKNFQSEGANERSGVATLLRNDGNYDNDIERANFLTL
jgi:hypothetical protein